MLSLHHLITPPSKNLFAYLFRATHLRQMVGVSNITNLHLTKANWKASYTSGFNVLGLSPGSGYCLEGNSERPLPDEETTTVPIWKNGKELKLLPSAIMCGNQVRAYLGEGQHIPLILLRDDSTTIIGNTDTVCLNPYDVLFCDTTTCVSMLNIWFMKV